MGRDLDMLYSSVRCLLGYWYVMIITTQQHTTAATTTTHTLQILTTSPDTRFYRRYLPVTVNFNLTKTVSILGQKREIGRERNRQRNKNVELDHCGIIHLQ